MGGWRRLTRFGVRGGLRGSGGGWVNGADERTRTADLLITSELLYQLSYVGLMDPDRLPVGIPGAGSLALASGGWQAEEPSARILH